MTNKRILPIGTLVLGLVFGLVMLITHLLVKPPAPPSELEAVLRQDFRQLTPFQLQSHNRAPLSEKDLQGKWSYIFFGYLSCPDVCPNTLHELSQFWILLKDETGLEPEDLQVLFVSVDPERDSTETLARYVNHFNKKFISATAGKGAIDRLTKQFGAGYILEAETGPGQYLVTHTSAIFLVDPLGRLVATFSQPHYAPTLLSQHKKITAYFSGSG
ncbi:MAG: SCO family protein [Gammaproteobacteria bacterium]|nr:SCO family protein [Gammaproteobacteria bacterium]MDH3858572.1 SCO family protein [Gammaproteobacteria bacterium]